MQIRTELKIKNLKFAIAHHCFSQQKLSFTIERERDKKVAVEETQRELLKEA